jgi:uncharacterized surface protein with fasciclin (FAS1) repeats
MRRWLVCFALLVVVACAAAGVGASASTGSTTSTKADAPTMNIVETAVAAGSFKTLVSLLESTGLDAVLAKPGPYTVFAPTDDAFAKVPAATLKALAADPALLKSVLLYHVVSGAVPASVATTISSARTVNGAAIGLSTVDGAVYVNNAKVTTADVFATNGVIHVIDSVLIPPAANAPNDTRVGYCAVAGNTTPDGAPIPAGRFLNLYLGQPAQDFHYAGAQTAIFVSGQGITCAGPPVGYTVNGKAPASLGTPGDLYTFYAP